MSDRANQTASAASAYVPAYAAPEVTVPPFDMDHVPAPLDLHQGRVLPEWIDHNGHLNVAFYLLAFDHATDTFFTWFGLTEEYRLRTRKTTFALECHLTYDREVVAGDPLRITTQLLDHEAKRVHFFHEMYHAREGWLAATNESISMQIDMDARRSANFEPDIQERLAAMAAAHGRLERPARASSVIAIRRR